MLTKEIREDFYTLEEAVDILQLDASDDHASQFLRTAIHNFKNEPNGKPRLEGYRMPGSGGRACVYLVKKAALGPFKDEWLTPKPVA